MAYQSAFLLKTFFPLNQHGTEKVSDARSTARETKKQTSRVVGVFREDDFRRRRASDGQKKPLKSPMPGSASMRSPIFATNAVKKMNALLLLEPVSPPSPEDACVANR